MLQKFTKEMFKIPPNFLSKIFTKIKSDQMKDDDIVRIIMQ
jgi:hypothetical protein